MIKKVAGVLLLLLSLPLALTALYQFFQGGVGIYMLIVGELESSAYGLGFIVGGIIFAILIALLSYFCLRYGWRFVTEKSEQENIQEKTIER